MWCLDTIRPGAPIVGGNRPILVPIGILERTATRTSRTTTYLATAPHPRRWTVYSASTQQIRHCCFLGTMAGMEKSTAMATTATKQTTHAEGSATHYPPPVSSYYFGPPDPTRAFGEPVTGKPGIHLAKEIVRYAPIPLLRLVFSSPLAILTLVVLSICVVQDRTRLFGRRTAPVPPELSTRTRRPCKSPTPNKHRCALL